LSRTLILVPPLRNFFFFGLNTPILFTRYFLRSPWSRTGTTSDFPFPQTEASPLALSPEFPRLSGALPPQSFEAGARDPLSLHAPPHQPRFFSFRGPASCFGFLILAFQEKPNLDPFELQFSTLCPLLDASTQWLPPYFPPPSRETGSFLPTEEAY